MALLAHNQTTAPPSRGNNLQVVPETETTDSVARKGRREHWFTPTGENVRAAPTKKSPFSEMTTKLVKKLGDFPVLILESG